jgi:hypothetical protein
MTTPQSHTEDDFQTALDVTYLRDIITLAKKVVDFCVQTLTLFALGAHV